MQSGFGHTPHLVSAKAMTRIFGVKGNMVELKLGLVQEIQEEAASVVLSSFTYHSSPSSLLPQRAVGSKPFHRSC